MFNNYEITRIINYPYQKLNRTIVRIIGYHNVNECIVQKLYGTFDNNYSAMIIDSLYLEKITNDEMDDILS